MVNPALFLQYKNTLFSAELKYCGILAFNSLNAKYLFRFFFRAVCYIFYRVNSDPDFIWFMFCFSFVVSCKPGQCNTTSKIPVFNSHIGMYCVAWIYLKP